MKSKERIMDETDKRELADAAVTIVTRHANGGNLGVLKGMLTDTLKMANSMAEIGNWGMCNAELLEAQRIIKIISLL